MKCRLRFATLRNVAFACSFVGSVHAAELGDVAQSLTADIQQAQTQLSAAENTISRERAELAQQLNRAQIRVIDLRDKTAAARRLADERTLSITQLETRLEEWQEQSRYQQRLITAFLDRVGSQSAGEAQRANAGGQLDRLQQFIDAQERNLQPEWHEKQILLPDGEFASGSLLTLGPVQWFLQHEQQSAGLVTIENDINVAALTFNGAATDNLLALHDAGTGRITFDPTLDRVMKLAGSEDTIGEQLKKGGLWVIPIIGFGVFATLITIAKGVFLYRLPPLQPGLAMRIRQAVQSGGAALAAMQAELQGAQAELLAITLTTPNQTHRDEQLYACLLRWRHKLEQWLGSIALTASVSPLLGLVGTVSGMITTFKLMTVFGSSDANTISAGISEAMIATKLGLVVAVPALVAHAFMSRMVKNYFTQLENLGVELSQLPLPANTAKGERHEL